MIKKEWQRLIHNPLLIVVLMAIILIPSIYAGFFLASMWDPYGELDKLPVAVVNKDNPVMYDGEKISIGEELVKNLKEDASLDYHFVDEQDAQTGLKNGDYYMVITIPEDFSHNATTVLDDNPAKMDLQYETNPATNYVAMKLSESAMTKIELSLERKVTETYAETLFTKLTVLGDSLDDASDGASQILDGEIAIQDGVTRLSDGTDALKNGTEDLESGIVSYTDGATKIDDGAAAVSSGATSLNSGASDVATGATAVANGAAELSYGLDTLNSSVALLPDATGKLNAGAYSLYGGIKSYTEYVDVIASSSVQLSDGLNSLNSAVNGENGLADSSAMYKSNMDQLAVTANYLASVGSIPQELADNIQALDDAYGKIDTAIGGEGGLGDSVAALSQGASELSTGACALVGENNANSNTLRDSAYALYEGINAIDASAATLASGVDQLSKGALDLKNGSAALATGTAALSDGAEDLAEGAAELKDGTSALVSNNDAILSGASDLKDGAADLNDGMTTLSDSMPDLIDGTTTLYDGLSDGAAKLDDTNKNEVNAVMFSNPLETTETKLTNVSDNGHAMAAYMMSVGLWVACLAFCLMYPLTQHDGLESGFKWWLSKASVLYPMAILQAVVLVLALHFALGFDPARLGQTIVVACLASVAFMSIMYFFNVLLGKVGSFLMLVFMVLQLAGSAGTYPIEVSGPLAAALNKFMPFTYTVAAFRSSIGGGEPFPISVKILLMIFLVSTLLTIFLFVIRGKKEQKGKANLHDVMEAHGFA